MLKQKLSKLTNDSKIKGQKKPKNYLNIYSEERKRERDYDFKQLVVFNHFKRNILKVETFRIKNRFLFVGVVVFVVV